MLRKTFAIIKKDFLAEASYKLSFLLNIFSVTAVVFVYFFIDRLFGQRITKHLQEFGVNYFSYVLLSMAFFSYIGSGIGSFSLRLRLEQMQGTLESILLTPTKPYVILLGLGLWNIIFSSLNAAVYIVLGYFVFKINFSGINIISTILILTLSIICFSGLGIISASFIIIFKKGNPVGWIINTLQGLLSGVYFPITVMPPFLQFAAKCFPITYAIRAIELAVYKGYNISQLKLEMTVLFISCIILLPLSKLSFEHALNIARRQGSLCQY